MNVYKELITLCYKALPVGTIREHADGKYKKVSENKWVRVSNEGEKKQEDVKFNDKKENVFSETIIKNSLSKRGLKGDVLLDNIDKINEIKETGANIDNNGFVTLYHRTSPENKAKIISTGKMYGEEDGLFFSTKEKGQNAGYGEAVVKFKIPIEKLEIDDLFDDEAHLRLPVKIRQLTNLKNYIKE